MTSLKKKAPKRLPERLLIFLAVFLAVCFIPAIKSFAQESKIPAFGLPYEEEVFAKGKKVYETYCIGCHGVSGDGKGPAAVFLNPKPRNFTLAEFRASSRASGSLPTDEDLFHTLAEGLRGTSMPPWKILPENERWALVAYIKSFAPDRWKTEEVRIPTAVSENPFVDRPREEAIQKGETAYHGIASCYSCHPVFVSPEKIDEARASYQMPPIVGSRPNPALSEAKPDSEGFLIKPPDFTWDELKRGTSLGTLYQVIANGISGTAMPTWKGILSEEDLWGMAYYIQSLAERRPRLVTEEDLRKREDWIRQVEEDRIRFEKEKAAAKTQEPVPT